MQPRPAVDICQPEEEQQIGRHRFEIPHDIPAATVQQELLGRGMCQPLARSRHKSARGAGLHLRAVQNGSGDGGPRGARNSTGDQWTAESGERANPNAAKRTLPALPARGDGQVSIQFLLSTDSQISPACTLGRRRAMFPAWGARHVARGLAAMVVVMMVVMIAVMVVACMGMATAGAAATVATQCGDRRGGLRQ